MGRFRDSARRERDEDRGMSEDEVRRVVIPRDRHGYADPSPQQFLLWDELREREKPGASDAFEYDNEKIDEAVLLVQRLFFGWMEERNNVPLHRYFGDKFTTPNEYETEKRALQAVSDLLSLSVPPKFVLDSLAMLFDQNSFSQSTDRTVLLKFRGPSRRDHYRDTHVAERVLELRRQNSTLEAAIFAASEEFRRSPEAIKKIWQRYRRAFPQYFRQER